MAFRMVHHTNMPHILANGIYSREHANFDPNYRNIGHPTIIGNRVVKAIPIEGHGNVGECVPFYFCGRTPMLYNIKTGYGVERLPQNDIVFIACPVACLTSCGQQWAFTNGNASVYTTEFYDDLADIGEVDWDVIRSTDFSGSTGTDRKRRKHAEFLVRDHVPVHCISDIVCLTEPRAAAMQRLVQSNGLAINVRLDLNNDFFFP